MNFTLLRLRATQLVADVLSYFDGGLESAISAFTRVDAKLHAVQTKVDARLQRETSLRLASFDRQDAVARAEEARRLASYDREDALLASRKRAATIQERIANLLDA